jgi:hypothetical protein
MAKTIMVDDSSVRDLRVAIYEMMNGNDINFVQMNMKSNLTITAFSSTGAIATKDNNIHSSPRTVATSVAQR